jgi:protein phosphatase
VGLRIVEKAALSDVGRQRQGNEDSYLERSPLFAVADGMGGARAGEVASRIAVEQFDADNGGDDTPEEQLAEVARGANRKIHQIAQEDSAYAGMGTTFTAALVTGKHIAIGHVGDSRLYRFRDGDLAQVSIDDTPPGPRSGLITQSLGGALPPQPVRPHAGEEPIVPARFLLCSDGLTDMLEDGDIADCLALPDADAVAQLFDLAMCAGGADNASIVVVNVEEG